MNQTNWEKEWIVSEIHREGGKTTDGKKLYWAKAYKGINPNIRRILTTLIEECDPEMKELLMTMTSYYFKGGEYTDQDLYCEDIAQKIKSNLLKAIKG
jgi:hypothetical protein